MNHEMEVDWSRVKSYATRENLNKGLAKLGLDTYGCRYMVLKTPDDRWTAMFMVGEYARANGGYIGFAAQHGFMSV